MHAEAGCRAKRMRWDEVSRVRSGLRGTAKRVNENCRMLCWSSSACFPAATVVLSQSNAHNPKETALLLQHVLKWCRAREAVCLVFAVPGRA